MQTHRHAHTHTLAYTHAHARAHAAGGSTPGGADYAGNTAASVQRVCDTQQRADGRGAAAQGGVFVKTLAHTCACVCVCACVRVCVLEVVELCWPWHLCKSGRYSMPYAWLLFNTKVSVVIRVCVCACVRVCVSCRPFEPSWPQHLCAAQRRTTTGYLLLGWSNGLQARYVMYACVCGIRVLAFSVCKSGYLLLGWSNKLQARCVCMCVCVRACVCACSVCLLSP